jgi:hypothetical protein
MQTNNKAIVIAVITLASAFVIQSCTKKNTTTVTTTNMTATVNGKSFSGIASASMSNGGLLFAAVQTGGTPATKEFNLYTKVNATGTYNMNVNTGQTGAGNTGVYAEGASAGTLTDYWTDSTHTGTIVITKYDVSAKKVSGTFSFNAIQFYPQTGTGTVNVTNGSFTDVSWQ